MIKLMFVISLFMTANLYGEKNNNSFSIEESLDDTVPAMTRGGYRHKNPYPPKIILYKKKNRIRVINSNSTKITFDKNRKNIVLINDLWGPYPLKLLIFNQSNDVIKTFISEEGSRFLFPANKIESAHAIKVYNAFEELLFEAKITME